VFTWKPYRTPTELLAHFCKECPDIPINDLLKVDTDWVQIEMQVREAMTRMAAGETPPTCGSVAILRIPRTTGHRYFEDWVTVAGSEKSLTPWHFQRTAHGGWWVQMDRAMSEAALECLILSAISGLMRCEQRHLPANFVRGGFESALVGRVMGRLYDRDFISKLDDETSMHLVQFTCGRTLDLTTQRVADGCRSSYISKTCGYEYPLERLELMERTSGAEVSEVFLAIRRFETTTAALADYPAELVGRLDALSKLPDFLLLKFMHACFDHPDHGWSVTMFRCLKLMTAAYFSAPLERFVNDDGNGGNGKSFLASVLEGLLGDYSHQVKESLLTQKPPGPESPSPALLELRGRRALLTPEVDGQLCVQSSWLKRLCDGGCQWHARELYAKREIAFKLHTVFFVCTNTRLQFTTLDGGIARRAICVSYPYQFVAAPREPLEKQLDPVIKSAGFLTNNIAGLLFLVLKCAKVFFGEGGNGITPYPLVVRNSTDALLVAEFAEAVEAYLEQYLEPSAVPSEYCSKSELLAALSGDPKFKELKVTKKDITDAVMSLVTFSTVHGRRERVRSKASGSYLKFRR
jgi:hypothetical protein